MKGTGMEAFEIPTGVAIVIAVILGIILLLAYLCDWWDLISEP